MLFSTSATFVGAFTGIAAQMYACALRKVPLFHQPYLHCGFALAGAIAGEWIVEKETILQKEVDAILEDRAKRNERFVSEKAKAK